MTEKSENLILGILAHVDAGKTTMAEGLLYHSGTLRTPGRVDHKDTFLDTFEMERARGITIFSKQARFTWKNRRYTLLDTPGHVDFSAEMERTLQVLDYAILVISAPDGVQGHDITLWNLLRQYQIPVFLFVNKMDMPGMKKEKVLENLHKYLDDRCIDFTDTDDRKEEICDELAMCNEELMQQYLEQQKVHQETVKKAIWDREVFPCYFGSALRLDGIEEFMNGLHSLVQLPKYGEEFGARVYKISRDPQGIRLTHMKITGGKLRVKGILESSQKDGRKEKADQIRLYSGMSYGVAEEVEAGEICAVTGLQESQAGMGYGAEPEGEEPMLEPVLSYQICLPEGSDAHGIFLKLCQLEEEEPQLHIAWDEHTQEISAKVMGEVQIEVLKKLIHDRYDLDIEFGAGSITYKETIAEPVEGVGHFEPLRHYAEVHLLMQPLERGSGLHFSVQCSEDILDRNWQRLILTHLEEKKHLGVLTGSEITDMQITLVAGKAHQKHTEGGDFRQATYRAVRQGLKMAKSVLLEPVYQFRLEIPAENVGRAMSDLTRMNGEFQSPQIEGGTAILTGSAPVSLMRDYQKEVISYSRGKGHLFCTLKGYEVCHNQEEVISQMAYDAEADLENPTGSVFCVHGAGFVVPWNEVYDYMHLDGILTQKTAEEAEEETVRRTSAVYATSRGWGDDSELEEIFNRTYGNGSGERSGWKRRRTPESGVRTITAPGSITQKKTEEKEYLLVDGYNIIFAIPQLKELAEINIDSARSKLMDLLCNYQGYKKNTLILVYDAYKVEGGIGSVEKYHNIYVVYTKEAETADQYIEKTVHEMGKKYHVTVATSDGLEQKIIWGAGASRMSAKELWEELELIRREIRELYLEKTDGSGRKLFQDLDPKFAEYLEEIRLGKKTYEEKYNEKDEI